MHFAICVWGIVRSLRFTIDSIHNYCLDPIVNAGHTYEIYMHTYKFSGVYDNLRSNERGLRLNFSEWQVLQPDHIFLEDQDIFDRSANFDAYQSHGDPWNNNYKSFENHMRAMNSLNHLALQVEKDSRHKHFDGMVYLRPDVTYLNELPFHLIEHIPNTLFVPDFHRSCHGGEYNDRMAMGDLQTGLIYGKKFQAALQYSKRKPLHSETFVYDYLTANNVTVKEIPFRFRRTRAKGEFHRRDSTAIVAPRHQKPQPEYTTFCVLRWLYTLLEMLTNHSVYVWNHDDNENLYCKPHDYLSIDEVVQYRKLSRKKRMVERRDVGSGSVDDFDAMYRSHQTRNKHTTDTTATLSASANTNSNLNSITNPYIDRQKRRRRKRASVTNSYITNSYTTTGLHVADRGRTSSRVSSVGGSDGRDLTGTRSRSSSHKAVRSTHTVQNTPTTHTTPQVLTQPTQPTLPALPTIPATTHSKYNLRGMGSREVEEKQARLKKSRNLQEV